MYDLVMGKIHKKEFASYKACKEYVEKMYKSGRLSKNEYVDCRDYAIWEYATRKEFGIY